MTKLFQMKKCGLRPCWIRRTGNFAGEYVWILTFCWFCEKLVHQSACSMNQNAIKNDSSKNRKTFLPIFFKRLELFNNTQRNQWGRYFFWKNSLHFEKKDEDGTSFAYYFHPCFDAWKKTEDREMEWCSEKLLKVSWDLDLKNAACIFESL